MSSAQGRFTSPDPIPILGQKLLDPQQWNMYSYVRNNPLRFLDPTGMYICAGAEKECKDFENARVRDSKNKSSEAGRDAAAAYGAADDSNGVTVRFVKAGDLGENTAGQVTAGLEADPNHPDQLRASADVAIARGQSGTALDATVAHEGVYVRRRSELCFYHYRRWSLLLNKEPDELSNRDERICCQYRGSRFFRQSSLIRHVRNRQLRLRSGDETTAGECHNDDPAGESCKRPQQIRGRWAIGWWSPCSKQRTWPASIPGHHKMRNLKSIAIQVTLLLGLLGIATARAQTLDLEKGPSGGVPLLVHADIPLYPPVALAARLSGTVRVKVQVNKGAVVNTETDSSAHAILLSAAEKNVKTWQFAPDANGPFELTYVYQLETHEADLPENPRVEMQLPVIKITGRPVKRTTVR